MGTRSTLTAMEVPIIGSDSVKWIDLPLPSSPPPPPQLSADVTSLPLLTDDFASSAALGDPPTYLIWKIDKHRPHALELLELTASKDFPKHGLRITFPVALSPLVFLCKNEITGGLRSHPYLLYALTVSGVAYLLRLEPISAYASRSVFRADEFVEFNLNVYGAVTSAAATPSGCLVVGRDDGSLVCFQLGTLDPAAPGFVQELRDDSGIGRLWGFVSRGRMVGAVQDLVISIVHGKPLVFVLHSDGILRVWDLSCHSRLFSHNMNNLALAGATSVRLWVGQVDNDSNMIPLAILYRHTLQINSETIYAYSLHCNLGDKSVLMLEPSAQNIPLEEVGWIDVRLTSDKICILKSNGLVLHNLLTNVNTDDACSYALQEDFVADQLFQSSESSSDDLLLMAHSIFSSSKDYIVPLVSSIFLRRLLLPGVHHKIALRSTFLDYNRHWSDSDFQSFTADMLKKEILSVIEHEGVNDNSMSIFCCWKNFCTRYFQNWCKSNAPCGLLVDSSRGTFGLVRKNSVSLFRCLEDIERPIDGVSDDPSDLHGFGPHLFDDAFEFEVLVEMLRCVINVSQQLGRTASAIFYETLISTPPVISSEEITPRLLKVLETGYSSTVAMLHISDLGPDVAWEKSLSDHKNLRKFSIDMLLSLHALHQKSVTWSRTLNVIESYLKFLIPRKIIQKFDAVISLDINASILVQSTSQVAKVMFESALDMLLFLSYLVSISGQIHMLHDDVSKIQLELIPMIQDIISEWLLIHFLATTPSESAAIEDFSSQLSLLQIDGNMGRRSWNEKLGKCEFTLAYIFLVNIRSSSRDQSRLSSTMPGVHDIIISTRDFASWIIWGHSGESFTLLSRATDLALILLRHGQYDAVEHLLMIVEAHLQKERTSHSIQDTEGGWCILHHLLGCCFLAQAHRGLHGVLKERKVNEAVRCFFRASSGKGSSQALGSLPQEAGLPNLGFTGSVSAAAWRLHYYQWAMQIFEQYNISEGACQFALAVLEQVEEAFSSKDEGHDRDSINESVSTTKGRLWANVFKFTLDLNLFYDAYCAIISNPDEESKSICLRRLIIVLYERGAIKILCGGQLPFIGLTEKVEQELSRKADCSDILAKPNIYKLLYAFEMHRHNWRRAASYMYLYSARLRTETSLKDYQHTSLALKEILNGLSAAINALHLVHPAHAWIDPLLERNSLHNEQYLSKKAKITIDEQAAASNDDHLQTWNSFIDLEKIENEFVLTSAEYLLSLAHVKWTSSGAQKAPLEVVDLLIQTNLYDMAFTILFRFLKGSELKRGLERVFSAMSLKCCPHRVDSSSVGDDLRAHGLLLTSSKDEMVFRGSSDVGSINQQSTGISQWGTLELYLNKYKVFHARLPLIVAETLLRSDPQIELPLWLVKMFKDGRREKTLGMTGQEANPALLFQLYVDYGRYREATNLLLEYIGTSSSMRPADIINRKRPFAVWFPYTAIQRLWCQLEELISSGHMVDQCNKLKNLLHGALVSHLEMVKVDSADALSAFK